MRISTCSVSPVFLHLPALLCQHMASSQPRGKGCACITSVIKLAVEFNCQHCLSGQLLLGQRESKGSLGQQCSGGSQQPSCMSTCMHERSLVSSAEDACSGAFLASASSTVASGPFCVFVLHCSSQCCLHTFGKGSRELGSDICTSNSDVVQLVFRPSEALWHQLLLL